MTNACPNTRSQLFVSALLAFAVLAAPWPALSAYHPLTPPSVKME